MQGRLATITDYGRQMKPFFSWKSQTFRLGQTIWADEFWDILGIFGLFINTHFGTVSPLSMFSINQPLFLQKKDFRSKSQINIWNLDIKTYFFL